MSSTEHVRVITKLNPLEFVTIPVRELAAGYSRIRLHGLDGEFWIGPAQNRELGESPIQYGPFPEPVREILRRFERLFAGVYDQTLDGWEEVFQRYMHPWREIGIWSRLADAYERFTSHLGGREGVDLQKKQDVFALLNGAAAAGSREYATMTARVGPTLTDSRVREILDYLFDPARDRIRDECVARLRTLFADLRLDEATDDEPDDQSEADAPAGWVERIAIEQLFGHTGDANEPNRQLLRDADIIVAVDPNYNNRGVFFGRAIFDDIVTGRGQASDATLMVWVDLDFETDDLEFLAAVVEHFKGKGSCCYH